MNKAVATREKLLSEARRLLWSRGYSNVSLREIAQGVGVDVALVSRYFGGKLGLFKATLDGAFETPDVADEDALVEAVLHMFVAAPRNGDMPSMLHLIQTNANDPDVGDVVRSAQAAEMQDKLDALLGDSDRAALFMSVIMGFAVAEKTLRLKGIAPHDTPAFEAQLRHMMTAALSFRPDERAS